MPPLLDRVSLIGFGRYHCIVLTRNLAFEFPGQLSQTFYGLTHILLVLRSREESKKRIAAAARCTSSDNSQTHLLCCFCHTLLSDAEVESHLHVTLTAQWMHPRQRLHAAAPSTSSPVGAITTATLGALAAFRLVGVG